MSNTPDTPAAPGALAQRILDIVPELTGAIDQTLKDQTGVSVSFILVAFVDGAAIHASNITPADKAIAAMVSLADSYRDAPPAELEQFDVTGTVPN